MFLYTQVNPLKVTATVTGFRAFVDLSRAGITTLTQAQSVRVYGDRAKSVEYAREIAGASEMYVLVPTLSASTELYIDYDGERSDYLATDPYGRNAVWPAAYPLVMHMQTSPDNSSSVSQAVTRTAVTQESGLVNIASEFDGATSEISVAHAVSLNPTSSYAIVAMIKSDKTKLYGEDFSYSLGNIGGGSVVNVSGTNYWKLTNGVTTPGTVFSYVVPAGQTGSFAIRARGYVSAYVPGAMSLRVTDNVTSTVYIDDSLESGAPTTPGSGQLTFEVLNNNTGNDILVEVLYNGGCDVWFWGFTIEWSGRDGLYSRGSTALMIQVETIRLQSRIDGVTSSMSGNSLADPKKILPGVWHTVVGYWSGTERRLFIDGVQINTGALTGTSETSTSATLVGKNASFSNVRFLGSIDEYRVQTVIPTNDEVAATHNNLIDESSFWVGWQEVLPTTSTPVSITVEGVERSQIIEFDTVRKQDNLNSEADIFEFEVLYHTGQTWRPGVNEEVELHINGVKEFAGVIIEVREKLEGHKALRYVVTAKDYSHYLDRRLVTERFEDMSVYDILQELIETYATEFTATNVMGAGIVLESVTFDRIPLTDCIDQLAAQNNYGWYVDYDKDLHFFEINDEAAPFNITDTSANYIYETLEFKTDFTQIRNRILFKGGDSETNVRTETLSGTGVKEEFVLAYKYAQLPTVTVGGVAKTVGIDNLDSPDDFQCLWSYQQKYLKFTPGNIPPNAANNIAVTGVPLLPLNVRVSDAISIAAYGVFEYMKEEKRISTRDDAVEYAYAELDAYKDPLREGSFETHVQGLRSGQTINVTSAIRGVSESFLIQSVEMTMVSQHSVVYRVELATLKTLKLTMLFQKLFRRKDVDVDSLEALYSTLNISGDEVVITDANTVTFWNSPPYYWGNPSSNTGTWNFSTWG